MLEWYQHLSFEAHAAILLGLAFFNGILLGAAATTWYWRSRFVMLKRNVDLLAAQVNATDEVIRRIDAGERREDILTDMWGPH